MTALAPRQPRGRGVQGFLTEQLVSRQFPELAN